MGDSQEERPPDNNLSSQGLAGDITAYHNDESEIFSKSDPENYHDLLRLNELSLQEKSWISPPETILSGSLDPGVTLAEVSLPDSSNGSDVTEPLLYDTSNREAREFSNQFCLNEAVPHEKSSPTQSGSVSIQVYNCDLRLKVLALKIICMPTFIILPFPESGKFPRKVGA